MLFVVCCTYFRLFELVEVLVQGGVRLVVGGTRDRDNVIKAPSELVLRVDKHLSTYEYQNMATRTSMSELVNRDFFLLSCSHT